MKEQISSLNRTAALQAMRTSLKPYWVPVEAGGIVLMAGPYDDEQTLEVLAQLLSFYPEIDTGSDAKFEVLADELTTLCEAFFQHAHLAVGDYELENYHDEAMVGSLIQMPSQPTFQFTFTREFQRLIPRMNSRAFHGQVCAMDLKRPYGDMTYHHIDMADALGEAVPRNENGEIELTPEAEERYDRLHEEMLFAVQAFWKFAQLD